MANLMTQTKYVEEHGELCPVCSSHAIEEQEYQVTPSHNKIEQTCVCVSCGSIWIAKYTLTRYKLMVRGSVNG